MVRKLYPFLLMLLVVSCNNFDFEQDVFNEELTLNIFVESNNDKIIDELRSVRIYEVETDRFHSEKWLIKNSSKRSVITNKESIKQLITRLSYRNAVPLLEKYNPQGIEYHVIAELNENKKAYLRVISDKNCIDCYKARPLAEVVFQLNLNKDLLESYFIK